MKKKNGNSISRRDFIKGAAAGAVGLATMGVLGACSDAADTTAASKESTSMLSSNASETTEGSSTEAAQGTTETVPVVSDSSVMTAEKSLEKWDFEIAPDPISEDDIKETVDAQVIVVGAGMAGLTTAYSAILNGADVILISASSAPISRGGSNFSAYSKVMQEYGIERFDPVEFFYNEMRAASFQVNQSMWMKGYNNSEEAMDWLIDTVKEDGLEVILERDNTFDKGPYYAHCFNTEGNDAMVSTGQQGAVESLAKHFEESGGRIDYNMVAEQLIREDNNTGRVSAVIAKNEDGEYIKYQGSTGIVLATGDFSANKQMLAKYCPHIIDFVGMEESETDYNTGFALTGIFKGDGQKMGLWVGAAWQKAFPNAPMMQGAWGGGHEPCGFHFGLNVNTKAKRYQREDVSSPYSSNHLLAQPDNAAYGIWTANYAQAIIDKGHQWYAFGSDFRNDPSTADEMITTWDEGAGSSYYKADTLDDLAEQLSLDAETLKATVARYNELCAAGVDEDFYKHPDFMVPINEEGPFYAAKNYAMFMTIMGGLRTNSDMQICDENDEPIPGLFNVGIMVGDMYANTYNFAIPGNCYGINCLTFGYMLGKDLADGKFDA